MEKSIKWIATVCLVAGTLVNALGYYPAGPMIMLVGSVLWLFASVMYIKDRALVATNAFLTLAGIIGLGIGYF